MVGRHKSSTDTNFISIQGVQDVENAAGGNRDPGDGTAVSVCSHSGLTGAAVIVGQGMMWGNYFLTEAEVDMYHAGKSVPAAANLSFWDKFTAEPGADLIFGDAGTESGTIALFSDGVDSNFSGSGTILPHRELAGRNLRLFRMAPEIYKLVVPLEYLSLELGDAIGLAHDSPPRASSILDSLEDHFMLDNWRRMYCVVLGRSIQPKDNTVALTVMNMESAICLMSGSALTKIRVNSEQDGTTRLNLGASETIARNSVHFIVETSEETGVIRLASVARFSEKTNHRGTIHEDAITNDVTNSAFLVGSFTDWTESLGTGGAVNVNTTERLFVDDKIQGNAIQVCEIVKSSDALDDISQSWTHGGGDSRVAFWHEEDPGNAASTPVDWSYQRSGASPNWWRESDSSWQTARIHNATTHNSSQFEREISNVISSITSGTVTLHIGIAAASGTATDKFYLGQVQHTEDALIYTDIVTLDGASETSADDDVDESLDNGGLDSRQVFHPDRGTLRLRLRAEQNGADMPNSTDHALFYWEVDSTNYDIVQLSKTSGGATRIEFERVISGSVDATAFASITLTRGTEYEIAVRWTSPSDGELGLSARTMSVFVDGTKGTDDQATGVHSTSDQTTAMWRGGSPVGGVLHSMNWIQDWELVQRVLPDEEILGRRLAA